jgi:hypothetical protein
VVDKADSWPNAVKLSADTSRDLILGMKGLESTYNIQDPLVLLGISLLISLTLVCMHGYLGMAFGFAVDVLLAFCVPRQHFSNAGDFMHSHTFPGLMLRFERNMLLLDYCLSKSIVMWMTIVFTTFLKRKNM